MRKLLNETRHKNGQEKKKTFHILDDADEPAVEEYHDNGKLKKRLYCMSEWDGVHESLLSRHKAPAALLFDRLGNLRAEIWAVDHDPHRDEGPSVIEYDETGSVTKMRFFQNGVERKATAHERFIWKRRQERALKTVLQMRAGKAPPMGGSTREEMF